LTDLKQTIAELEQRLQASLADRDELLQQQAATNEVLQVINASSGDLAPVFDAILERAMRLCEAEFGLLATYDGGQIRTVAARGVPPAFAEFRKNNPPDYGPGTGPARILAGERVVHIVDLKSGDPYRAGDPNRRAVVDLGGARTVLLVPLLRNESVLGCITIYRKEVRPYSDKQIVLLQNFADQAVIAIENARLFNETQQALERQTATAEILKVIASSPTDVRPVFGAIAERSNQLIGGFSTSVFRFIDDVVALAAFTPVNPEADAILRAAFPGKLANFPLFETVRGGEVVQTPDAQNDESAGDAGRAIARARGFRSRLLVPLIGDKETIGVISVTRKEPGRFADQDVELLKTFADQAVIAIQNVRLFDQVQERTRELSKSLDDLRTAQDRLVQTEKLASLGQLTAGIAHEIKNPLNFVNNFSALSAELVDELNDTLKPAALEGKMRLEVDDLTEMLKDNLEKVVQHGKRADSIVKNMLMHSREGSGEHRPADINAIVDESLNLAYHGARAEKPGFSIALQRDLDPSVGKVDVYPQEITRALLNLISNGFYATTKRKVEAGDGFEPILSATTKNLGGKVEIRIRDNGTGIPNEVKEKIFNPFFTTKPSGEGTGLGLSMCHDIIVKQHGGSIDVETEPGLFTEFEIVLPRTNQR
jgi:two-component system NtrC family sensor kinase